MPNDEGTIRYYLKTVGPMTWNFQAYPNFDLYQNGIYDKVEGSDPGGHMILLVGYGTSTDGGFKSHFGGFLGYFFVL